MGKKNKVPGPTDKIFSLDEMDEATLAQFNNGRLQGMYKCHEVFSDSVARLKQSLEDIWAIEYNGIVTPEKQAHVDKLTFAINTLITLDDMFQDEYDTQLSKLKRDTEEDDRIFTSEEFLQHLRDLENE